MTSPRRTSLRVTFAVAVACAVMLSPVSAMAEEHTVAPRESVSQNSPTSAELVERAELFDGMVVVYTGEAIGEAMVRGHWAWLHINDDAYMERNIEEGAPLGGLNSGMPVWVPAAEAEKIEVFGDYRHQGDIIEVRGVFNASCPEHGGDMDIHALHVEIVRAGRDVEDPVSGAKLGWAIALAAAAGGMFLLDRNIEKLREDARARRAAQ